MTFGWTATHYSPRLKAEASVLEGKPIKHSMLGQIRDTKMDLRGIKTVISATDKTVLFQGYSNINCVPLRRIWA